jgi:HEAT repeat protein
MKKLWLVGLVLVLGGCGKANSTGEWVQRLNDRDAAVRLHAIQALAGRKADAAVVVPALVRALKDENAFVRRDAARALGRMATEAKPAAAALGVAIRDKNRGVRQDAAAALKAIDPVAAAKAGVP